MSIQISSGVCPCCGGETTVDWDNQTGERSESCPVCGYIDATYLENGEMRHRHIEGTPEVTVDSALDRQRVLIMVRDLNGNCRTITYRNRKVAYTHLIAQDPEIEEENDEILIVIWGEHLLYDALKGDACTAEDLIGFFA